MPKPTRSARSRSRSVRRSSSPVATLAAAPVAGADPSASATPAATAAAGSSARAPMRPMRPATTAQPRAIITDYKYVVSELQRIMLLTVIILVLLIGLSFIVN